MKQEKFDQYIKMTSRYIIRLNQAAGVRDELLQLIEKERNASKDDPSSEEFFTGEYAFYTQHYEQSLKHYLKATSIPHFTFFCYRASAYLFHMMGNLDKALGFVHKALHLYPNDYMALILCEQLLVQDNQKEDALEVQSKIKALENELGGSPVPEPNKKNGAEESEKLACLMQERPEKEEDLFADEFSEALILPLQQAEGIQHKNPGTRESLMNTESDIFSSPKSEDSGMTHILTHRLYPSNPALQMKDPYACKNTKKNFAAFEDLKNLSNSILSEEHEATSRFIAEEMGLDHDAGKLLERRIKAFQDSQGELTRSYLEQGKARSNHYDHCLYYLNGWYNNKSLSTPYTQNLYLTEQSRKTTGGMFIRWNGKGIAVNPGPHFLEYFHEQGLHIRDIDYVIVTGEQPESYADVKEIYDLNYQLNKMSHELQIIHYYFNHKAFQELSRFLKPHFKQERNSLHSLELFVDSPDVEKIDLDEGISLHYFLATSRDTYISSQESKEERAARNHNSLGIRFELKSSLEKGTMRLGYITHAAWNPLMAHHLGNCDILIAGFGNTGSNDYNKLAYNADSLGYYGTYTLLEEVVPKLLLCGEFSGREGDIRLETAQKLRQEYISNLAKKSRYAPIILPADTGLFINLKNLKVKCSVTEEWVDPAQVKAIKTANAFGKLEFLAPGCFY